MDPVVFVFLGELVEGVFSFVALDFDVVVDDDECGAADFCGDNRSLNDNFSRTAADFSLSGGGINGSL